MKDFPAFRDCKIIFDTALAHDKWPLEYTLPSPGEASDFRMRMNRLRTNMRRYDKKVHGKPFGECPYDEIVVLLEGDKVILDKRTPTGTLRFDGKEIKPVDYAPGDYDEDDFELEDGDV